MALVYLVPSMLSLPLTGHDRAAPVVCAVELHDDAYDPVEFAEEDEL